MKHISESKKKIVEELVGLVKKYPIVGLVNMSDIPAPQLQMMKKEMRGKVRLFMTKKRLMKLAIEKSKQNKKSIEALPGYFQGMPALLFTDEDPFKLSRLLQKSRTKGPAKAGQIAPQDIMISKGPTPFAPGPVISELSGVGLKVGVENGKVAVKEDTVIVKKGELIKPKVAEILTRLDIRPMDIGLGLIAAYESGLIYEKEILDIDEVEVSNNVNMAATQAFNLAFYIAYTTGENIGLLLAKAYNDAKSLGVQQEVFESDIIDILLGKAAGQMRSLKDIASIDVSEQSKDEKKEAELKKVKNDNKPQPSEDPKQAKIQEKPVDSSDEVKKKPIEKKEDKEKVSNADTKKETPTKEIKQEDTDQKVKKMVENTKKFVEGKEETADDLLKEVSEDK
jgi:large subunit ribosomal protein L10